MHKNENKLTRRDLMRTIAAVAAGAFLTGKVPSAQSPDKSIGANARTKPMIKMIITIKRRAGMTHVPSAKNNNTERN